MRCSWQDEPGEYGWILRRVGANAGGNENLAIADTVVSVRILEFDDYWAREEDAAGREAFTTECSAMRLATQLKGQMQQLLNECGLDGYKKRWIHHAFPTDEFERLSEWINEAKRSRQAFVRADM